MKPISVNNRPRAIDKFVIPVTYVIEYHFPILLHIISLYYLFHITRDESKHKRLWTRVNTVSTLNNLYRLCTPKLKRIQADVNAKIRIAILGARYYLWLHVLVILYMRETAVQCSLWQANLLSSTPCCYDYGPMGPCQLWWIPSPADPNLWAPAFGTCARQKQRWCQPGAIALNAAAHRRRRAPPEGRTISGWGRADLLLPPPGHVTRPVSVRPATTIFLAAAGDFQLTLTRHEWQWDYFPRSPSTFYPSFFVSLWQYSLAWPEKGQLLLSR